MALPNSYLYWKVIQSYPDTDMHADEGVQLCHQQIMPQTTKIKAPELNCGHELSSAGNWFDWADEARQQKTPLIEAFVLGVVYRRTSQSIGVKRERTIFGIRRHLEYRNVISEPI
ncbi:hypothetical protein CHU98_g9552 [Xylaria longipes]|nr:hypothetical protein CHU98_g9552 [Xylaria longipes]